jgi:hypothetical protein
MVYNVSSNKSGVLTGVDLTALVARFDGPSVVSIVLMGSHATGSAGPFSDVDLLRLVTGEKPPGDGSHWLDGRLVTVSSRTLGQLNEIFDDPREACTFIQGLRLGRALLDRDAAFAAVQRRAAEFVWDDALQAKANEHAANELVGWIEEVHKALEGLRRGHTGRMLNGLFGLTWGLSNVVMVQRGVLLGSDNDIWDAVNQAVGMETRWVVLRRRAFGINGGDLQQQVRAGLALYGATVALMEAVLPEPQRSMIVATVERIHSELGEDGHGAN